MVNEASTNTLVVGIGDMKIGKAPASIKTTLGSCVAVCLLDPGRRCGGLVHVMLADSCVHNKKLPLKAGKYADTGIPELLNQLRKGYGSTPGDLKAKLFGGARVLSMMSATIGDDNVKACQSHLRDHSVKIVAEKTGGDKGYQVDFDVETGAVQCRIFGQPVKTY
jgi:chemotaxis protein CheD